MAAVTRAQIATPPAMQPRGPLVRAQIATPPAMRPRSVGTRPTDTPLYAPFDPGLNK